MVKHYIGMLTGSQSLDQRLQMLQMVANQVDVVAKLDAEDAAKLAKYLVKFKPDDREHQQMMDHLLRVENGLNAFLESLERYTSSFDERYGNLVPTEEPGGVEGAEPPAPPEGGAGAEPPPPPPGEEAAAAPPPPAGP